MTRPPLPPLGAGNTTDSAADVNGRMVDLLGSLIVEREELRSAAGEATAEHRRHMESLFVDMLTVLDALDRNLRQLQQIATGDPRSERVIQNLLTLQRRFHRLLRDREVEEIETTDGMMFNPTMHTVGDRVVRPDLPLDAVVETSAPGYVWHGKVLRRAEVVIARRD